MNSFKRIFKVFAKSLSNLVHHFWGECFHKPKLLLAANRLVYLNTSIGISKIHDPRILARYSFSHRITTSGETSSRYLFHEGENAANFGKIIIAVNYFRKTLHRRCLTGF